MSMISSLINELRKSEQEWNQSNMFELARMCREAADTITELRGALQVASVDYRHLSDENAKLLEAVKRMYEHIRQTCGECDGWYCSNFDEDNECCVFDTLVRELVVEVEG